jgi:hypothetical protein
LRVISTNPSCVNPLTVVHVRSRASAFLNADQVAVNYHKTDLTPSRKAMLAFAMKVATESASIVDADFDALCTQGSFDEDVWDIGAIAALSALSKRMANMISMRPNDEFYLLGATAAGGKVLITCREDPSAEPRLQPYSGHRGAAWRLIDETEAQ